MQKMTKNKPEYPDNTLETELRLRNIPVHALWEQKGPKDTNIAWIVMYLVQNHLVLHLTYTNGDGWDAFTGPKANDVSKTVEDVIARTS